MTNFYSLIITVFNEEASIDKFIHSLNNQTLYPDEFIVVDGGSSDDTVLKIKESTNSKINLKLIVDETCSKKHSIGPIARGRNVAIAKAKFNNIIVTDAGCLLSPDWFENIVFGFEQDADVVSGCYMAHVENDFQAYISDVFCKNITSLDSSNPKSFEPSSRSFGFKKELWLEAGRYPENSYTAEDTKFVRNLFQLTDNVYLAKNAVVFWDVPRDFKELCTKVQNYGFGDGVQRLDLFKYFVRLSALILFPISFVALILTKRKLITLPIYFYQVKGFIKGVLNV
ncbi:glycosyltransferase [Vibrio cyclitrophicus]